MPYAIAWCGFLGAWLLVAGPLGQPCARSKSRASSARRSRRPRHGVDEPPPGLPAGGWCCRRSGGCWAAARGIYRHRVGEAMDDEALLAFLTVKDILNAWLYVAVGVLPDRGARRPGSCTRARRVAAEWAFWLGVVGMVVFCVGITVGRTRRRHHRPAVNELRVTAREWAERLGEVARRRARRRRAGGRPARSRLSAAATACSLRWRFPRSAASRCSSAASACC